MPIPVLFIALVSIVELSYLAYNSPQKLLRLVLPVALASIAAAFYNIPFVQFISSVLVLSFFVVEIGRIENIVSLPFALYAVLITSYSALALLFSVISIIPDFAVSRRHHTASKRVETHRDFLQTSIGILIALSLVLFGLSSTSLFISLGTCLALSLGTYVKLIPRSSFSKLLASLEKSNAPFGFGAFWLAFSLLLAASLAKEFAPAIFSALMFGDPFATFVGMHVRSRHNLPYNNKKSFEGTLAFFVATALAGFFFVGLFSLLFAFVGAVVESISKSIDDNLSIGVVLTVLALLLLLLLD